jgi:hypothetical protein
MDGAGEHYRRAVALDPTAEEANLRLGNGFDRQTPGTPWRDGSEGTRFREAADALDRGDLEDAERRFLSLCRDRPGVFKYRLGLGLVRVALRRSAEVGFGRGVEAAYAALPAPDLPRIEEVVLGYTALSEADRHAVRVAVLPARGWWDALIRAGATHAVLGLEESLHDAAERAGLSDQRTFDGRWYAHLRGVGGLHAATGVEKLREARTFAFNTLAHEFAHQLLDHALGEAISAEVDALYRSALAEGRCLDYYAASNVDEYFAQGYEAFVSPAKRGCLKETERHTRSELLAKDPGLHALLTRVLDLSHETPEALRTFEESLGSLRAR